ncbi:MAG: DUF167 domain-containing protein [bacterium]|nr:DUF167 domain-containing protein [bacterium]
MRISVKVKAHAKREFIKRVSDTDFIVSVSAPAEGGKANKAVIKALAKYFKCRQADVEIMRGASSPNKIVDIL